MEIKTILNARIVNIGNKAKELLEGGIIILFGENAPQDFVEYCHIVNVENFQSNVRNGDYLILDNTEFLITSVGSYANTSLKELGHVTFMFNNETHDEIMPGSIYVEGIMDYELSKNSNISIVRRNKNVSING